MKIVQWGESMEEEEGVGQKRGKQRREGNTRENINMRVKARKRYKESMRVEACVRVFIHQRASGIVGGILCNRDRDNKPRRGESTGRNCKYKGGKVHANNVSELEKHARDGENKRHSGKAKEEGGGKRGRKRQKYKRQEGLGEECVQERRQTRGRKEQKCIGERGRNTPREAK